jgi:hypothetical protein
MTNRTLHASMHSERGQSFTELAISLTFLLVLLSGVADLGRAFFTYIALRDSVQEGASYAGIAPTDCAGIRARVVQHTTQPVNLADPGVVITVDVDGTVCESAVAANIAPGDPIVVTITYNNFQIATPFIGAITGPTLSLSASVTNSVVIEP